MKPIATIAVGVFSIVALAHLLRIAFAWEVTAAEIFVPIWVSVVAAAGAAALAFMLWRETHGPRNQPSGTLSDRPYPGFRILLA